MAADCLIRPLTIADYDALLTLWQRAGLTHKPRGRDSREKIARELAAAPQSYLGLFVDDRLVAALVATFDGRKGWINRVAVEPDCRGRGYGRKMIAEAEKNLREKHGATVISALIEQGNIPSRRLFEKCGYIPWEEVAYYSKRDHPDA
jgi:ribosomal protein S18 acetylase RimI-like enzyme